MVFIILSKSIGVGAIAGYIQAFSSTEQQLQDLSFYGKWFLLSINTLKIISVF